MEVLTWRPKGRSRERILVYGIPGTGKTRAYLSIAERLPDATFYILDNDNSVDRLLETEFEGLSCREEWFWRGGKWVNDDEYCTEDGNIVLYHSYSWAQHVDVINTVFQNAGRNDWFVIDTATALWDDVQEWYTNETYGQSLADQLLAYKKSTQKGDGKTVTASEAQFVDWQFINPIYFREVNNNLVNPPCHLFVTAEETKVTDLDKDRSTRDLYGMEGYKPKGQKKLGHITQTVLRFRKKASGEWTMSTMKDRGRNVQENVGFEDFAQGYLWTVAGWRPRKVTV